MTTADLPCCCDPSTESQCRVTVYCKSQLTKLNCFQTAMKYTQQFNTVKMTGISSIILLKTDLINVTTPCVIPMAQSHRVRRELLKHLVEQLI